MCLLYLEIDDSSLTCVVVMYTVIFFMIGSLHLCVFIEIISLNAYQRDELLNIFNTGLYV